MYALYTLSRPMSARKAPQRRGLSRSIIVARALELGNVEGLDAVTLRRLAGDFGVTPMAIYRHVNDKQDLINAMTEAVMEDLDITVGFRPSMDWTDRIRKAMNNLKEQYAARPLTLPLSIAYSGEGPPAFWRMTEDLLGIAYEAGFRRRQALVLIRVISNLIAGYLLLTRQDSPSTAPQLTPREIELVRKRFELIPLALPADRFPNLIDSVHELADVWLSHPDRWWNDTVDLIVLGMEAMLDRQNGKGRARKRGRAKG
jgi:TetR/AcrR family transcriptional regulator, tetracycline repressor protein